MNASPLDYLLVGLLSGGPRSGYDLRRQIGDSPLRVYSDSPGAIYPALRRLAIHSTTASGDLFRKRLPSMVAVEQ